MNGKKRILKGRLIVAFVVAFSIGVGIAGSTTPQASAKFDLAQFLATNNDIAAFKQRLINFFTLSSQLASNPLLAATGAAKVDRIVENTPKGTAQLTETASGELAPSLTTNKTFKQCHFEVWPLADASEVQTLPAEANITAGGIQYVPTQKVTNPAPGTGYTAQAVCVNQAGAQFISNQPEHPLVTRH